MIPFNLLRAILFIGSGLFVAIALWTLGRFIRQLFQKRDPIITVDGLDDDLEKAIREHGVRRRLGSRPPAA